MTPGLRLRLWYSTGQRLGNLAALQLVANGLRWPINMSASNTEYDVAVVGGGIVGLATALAIVQNAPRTRLIVLEAEDHLAAHQSGHNSGVIHSGLYYAPGSLKARLCHEGRELLYRFCDEHGINARRCGKVVVATTQAQVGELAALSDNGRANGLAGLELLSASQLRDREPHAAGVAALLVPQTGVVDYAEVTRALAAVIRESGREVRCGSPVSQVHPGPQRVYVETPTGTIKARTLVGCAGLQADRLARACGVDPGVQIVPFRGQYRELIPDRRDLVRALIYPAPDRRYPFLGVHLTRHIDDTVSAGPNAVLALRRDGYDRFAVSARDMASMALGRGFWAMAVRNWPAGLREINRSVRKSKFIQSVQSLVPEITASDLKPAGSGIRAQAVTSAGKLLDDFHIVESRRMVHVLNAPSPAATACLAIGRYIADKVIRQIEAAS